MIDMGIENRQGTIGQGIDAIARYVTATRIDPLARKTAAFFRKNRRQLGAGALGIAELATQGSATGSFITNPEHVRPPITAPVPHHAEQTAQESGIISVQGMTDEAKSQAEKRFRDSSPGSAGYGFIDAVKIVAVPDNKDPLAADNGIRLTIDIVSAPDGTNNVYVEYADKNGDPVVVPVIPQKLVAETDEQGVRRWLVLTQAVTPHGILTLVRETVQPGYLPDGKIDWRKTQILTTAVVDPASGRQIIDNEPLPTGTANLMAAALHEINFTLPKPETSGQPAPTPPTAATVVPVPAAAPTIEKPQIEQNKPANTHEEAVQVIEARLASSNKFDKLTIGYSGDQFEQVKARLVQAAELSPYDAETILSVIPADRLKQLDQYFQRYFGIDTKTAIKWTLEAPPSPYHGDKVAGPTQLLDRLYYVGPWKEGYIDTSKEGSLSWGNDGNGRYIIIYYFNDAIGNHPTILKELWGSIAADACPKGLTKRETGAFGEAVSYIIAAAISTLHPETYNKNSAGFFIDKALIGGSANLP